MDELGFHTVPMNVANNPIARAISRRRMQLAVRDFCTRVFLLVDGEDVQHELMAAAHVLAVAVRICEAREVQDSPSLRVMAGGMSAIAQCSNRRWRWRALDATAVDIAITNALDVLSTADAYETRAAWAHVAALNAKPNPGNHLNAPEGANP